MLSVLSLLQAHYLKTHPLLAAQLGISQRRTVYQHSLNFLPQ